MSHIDDGPLVAAGARSPEANQRHSVRATPAAARQNQPAAPTKGQATARLAKQAHSYAHKVRTAARQAGSPVASQLVNAH